MNSLRCKIVLIATTLLFGCGRSEPTVSPGDIKPADAQPAEGISIPNYYALVVGISDYATNEGQKEWGALGTARRDAETIGDLLENEYGFRVERLLDREATHDNIMAALGGLADLGEKDAALLYFAGHGHYDENLAEGYWIPVDARKEYNGRSATGDWIWNSTVDRIVRAAKCRHILIVADACYAGSLFRSDVSIDDVIDERWYKRALAVPSRYLITSGNVEPVLDSGIHHSIFAREIINQLRYARERVFSASELGMAVRKKVSQLTGQLVRMGPMASEAHAGGEFVFVRQQRATPDAVTSLQLKNEPSIAAATTYRSISEEMTDIGSIDALYSDPKRHAAAIRQTADLVDYLESRKSETDHHVKGTFVRPRILAYIGPYSLHGGQTEEQRASQYRLSLRSELEKRGGCIVVDRKILESLFTELSLSASDLTDTRLAGRIGRLMPASMLAYGELITVEEGEELFIRIVDTETSRVLVSSSRTIQPGESVQQVCSSLADELVSGMQSARPLVARLFDMNGSRAKAGIGRFHVLPPSASFEIIGQGALDVASATSVDRAPLGIARILVHGEEASTLEIDWSEETASLPAELWVRELPPSNRSN